jgi:spermidine/putrescine transport system substrate-binding protein
MTRHDRSDEWASARRLSRDAFLRRTLGAAAAITAAGYLAACGDDDGGSSSTAAAAPESSAAPASSAAAPSSSAAESSSAGSSSAAEAPSTAEASSTEEAAASVPAPTVKPEVDGDLNWYTWAEFVPPDVVSAFEKEYGVKVKQSFMSTNAESVQKLAAGQPFDLITTNNGYMGQFLGGNLLQSFDLGDLKNAGEIADYFQTPYWDNGEYRYTVPYDYGPTGIMYRADKGFDITGSWDDIWSNAEAADGHLYLLSAIGDTLGMALLRNGHDANSADPDEVNEAADSLVELKKHVAAFTTDLAPPVADGKATLMEGWSTPIYIGLQQAEDPENIKFYVPKEGPLMAADTLSIGAKAKAPGTALLFMDWLLKPENNAALGEFLLLKTGANAGNAAFAEAIKQYPDFDYSDDLLADRKNWKEAPTGDRLKLWNQAWSRVIA